MRKNYDTPRTRRGVVSALMLGAAAVLTASPLWAANGLASLKTVPVPKPANLAQFVVNEPAAVRLGKALFWETQVGGDGATACASCHFVASVDNRTRNQVNPHGGNVFESVAGANAEVTFATFPITTNDAMGSAGVIKNLFQALSDGPADLATAVSDPVFNLNGVNIRQPTGRNTPSFINAVYNFRNFWDGRAREVFNGVNPFGAGDPNARVLMVDALSGSPSPVAVSINNGSLASQAVGPPNNSVEMSWAGRSFPQLGRKLLSLVLVPLGQQTVATTDSVLGAFANLRLAQGSIRPTRIWCKRHSHPNGGTAQCAWMATKPWY